MRHLIVGTAGHIDHGKTALVRALTGIDTDRLEEEKRRGISIDLGFAHLEIGELRVGFVDVPGHERFVKNMLAGVGGIDLVLLVIAADESIKPQTREHFDICRLLGIAKGIVVITKSDLVDADILELVRLEAEEFVAGSFLEGAPVVAVSAKTGAGLEELKSEIARLAKTIPGRDTSRYFRLPIDRAFSMKGFGTVVTGTLIAGTVRVEQEIEVYPVGRKVRVRGLQVHGTAVTRASAGQRTAVNLAGIEPSEIARGMVLGEVGRFRPAQVVEGSFQLLGSAKPLKQRAPVHFHAGTAEVEAEARVSGDRVQPGERALVRWKLKEPVLLLPGDRYIVRMFSPVVTIGGGVVVDPHPPRRFGGERLAALERAGASERVRLLVKESRYGLGMADLVARLGLTEAEIERLVAQDGLTVSREPQFWVIEKELFTSLGAGIRKALAAYHREHPLQPGLSKEEVRSRQLGQAPGFLLDAVLGANRDMVAEGEVLRLASHKLALKGEEEQAIGKIEGAFREAGLAVPAAREVLAGCGVDPVRARSLLQILLRDKRLVKVAEDLLFHAEALSELRKMLAGRKGQRFAVPEFKEWTGVSRKYAIPLLEFLDRERVTRRDGDARVVL